MFKGFIFPGCWRGGGTVATGLCHVHFASSQGEVIFCYRSTSKHETLPCCIWLSCYFNTLAYLLLRFYVLAFSQQSISLPCNVAQRPRYVTTFPSQPPRLASIQRLSHPKTIYIFPHRAEFSFYKTNEPHLHFLSMKHEVCLCSRLHALVYLTACNQLLAREVWECNGRGLHGWKSVGGDECCY